MRNPFSWLGEPEPDNPEPRLAVMPGGALIDPGWAEAEAERARCAQRSAEAESQARRDQVVEQARFQGEHEQARIEQAIRELPPHLRSS